MTSRNVERSSRLWLYGVACRRELLAAGERSRAIQARIEAGRYVRIYDGVYALGHAGLTLEARRRAIVLACGPGAVLSHRSAGAAWNLIAGGGARWEVIVRRASPVRPNAPVKVYRRPSLGAAEITELDGIPVTTVSRTLLDLAAHLAPHQLRRALEQAELQQLFDLTPLTAAFEAHPRQPGRRKLLTLLGDLSHHGLPRTRSDVEAAFVELCLKHGLPRPATNTTVDGREHDFVWPAQRLIAEVDGYTYHRTRRAFATDRTRDRAATAAGYRVVRFTATEVTTQPMTVAAELHGLLARSR